MNPFRMMTLGWLCACVLVIACHGKTNAGIDAGVDANTDPDAATDPDLQMRFPIDLMLIYQGDSEHTPWFKEDYQSYLYREREGQTEWLFDGFLFLALDTAWDGHTYYFDGEPYRGELMATKEVWHDWLETLFAPGRGPNGLEAALGEAADAGHHPPYKRKVIFAIPYPVYDDKPWGELNGQELDFSKNADRLRAVNWYIGEVLALWAAQNYQHIELAGFYWLREEAFRTEDVQLIGQVSQAVGQLTRGTGAAGDANEHRYDFYWIPYNAVPDNKAGQWDELGFDIGYFQPNHYFSTDIPLSQLEDAISFAIANGMGLQMEFSGRMYDPIDSADFLPRYLAYVEQFELHQVWANRRLAYYDSAGAWRYMALEPTTSEVQQAYEALAERLADRQRRYLDFQ